MKIIIKTLLIFSLFIFTTNETVLSQEVGVRWLSPSRDTKTSLILSRRTANHKYESVVSLKDDLLSMSSYVATTTQNFVKEASREVLFKKFIAFPNVEFADKNREQIEFLKFTVGIPLHIHEKYGDQIIEVNPRPSELSAKQFISAVSQQSQKPQGLLLFWGGFNTDAVSGAQRAAVLSAQACKTQGLLPKDDSRFTSIVFDWPSQRLKSDSWPFNDYPRAKIMAENSAKPALKFIETLNKIDHFQMHIVGHSMGSDLIRYTIQRYSQGYASEVPNIKNFFDSKIFSLTLFAADVPLQRWDDDIVPFLKKHPNITPILYTSDHDDVLTFWSEKISGQDSVIGSATKFPNNQIGLRHVYVNQLAHRLPVEQQPRDDYLFNFDKPYTELHIRLKQVMKKTWRSVVRSYRGSLRMEGHDYMMAREVTRHFSCGVRSLKRKFVKN